MGSDGHLAIAEQFGRAFDTGDFVFFEQSSDAASELFNNLIFTSHHSGYVNSDLANRNAVGFKLMLGSVHLLRRVQ